MNNKKLALALWGLAFFLALVVVVQSQQESKENKAQFETILIGKGSSPKWSPDGTKIAFISEDGWLCVTKANGKGITKSIAPIKAVGFDWISPTEFILWEQEEQRIEGVLGGPIIRIKKISLDGVEELIIENSPRKGEVPRITFPIFLPDGTVGYYQNYFKQPPNHITGERTFKVIQSGKLKPNLIQKQIRAFVVPSGGTGAGDIWLESMDGEIKKRVTTGRLFSFPELSPDGTKILAICGNLCGSMCVVDLQGNHICVGKEGYEDKVISSGALGPPQAKWSPDGKKIAYMYMTGKGEQLETIGSDIYIENPDGTGRIQITDTPDEYEVYPVWSPDGTKIACTGYDSHKIYVIKIK